MNRRGFNNERNRNFFRGSKSRDSNFEMDDDSPSNVGGINESSCQQLADIIGGEVVTATPVCVVMRLRNIRATI